MKGRSWQLQAACATTLLCTAVSAAATAQQPARAPATPGRGTSERSEARPSASDGRLRSPETNTREAREHNEARPSTRSKEARSGAPGGRAREAGDSSGARTSSGAASASEASLDTPRTRARKAHERSGASTPSSVSEARLDAPGTRAREAGDSSGARTSSGASEARPGAPGTRAREARESSGAITSSGSSDERSRSPAMNTREARERSEARPSTRVAGASEARLDTPGSRPRDARESSGASTPSSVSDAGSGAPAGDGQAASVESASGVGVHLAELEARAQSSRPWRRGRDARMQGARARIQSARAAYSPTISFSTDAMLTPGQRIVDINGFKVNAAFPIDEPGTFRPALRYGATFDVRGNLYDFGRTSDAVDAAEAEARAEQADARSAEEQSVRDLRAGYVRWASAHALWLIAQRTQRAAAESLARTRAAIEEGARPEADQTAAESGEGFAQLELERALAELESAREDLGFVAAVELADTAFPADDVLNATPMAAPEAAGQNARSDMLRQQLAAAEASAHAHDHAFTPVVSASAQAGIQGLDENLFPIYRVGVSVLVPLWDGGSEAALRAQAHARAAQIGAQAEELERTARRARERSRTLKNQAERRIAVADKLLAVCRTRVAQLEAASPLGAASYVELSDARNSVARAETELVLARALRAQVLLGLD